MFANPSAIQRFRRAHLRKLQNGNAEKEVNSDIYLSKLHRITVIISSLNFCYQPPGLLWCKTQDDGQNANEIGSHLFMLQKL